MSKNRQRRLLEKTLLIQGKAAKIHSQLMNTGLFSNNHEAAEFAMLVGIVFQRTEKKDLTGDEEFKIQKETMRDSGDLIKRIYRFCMLLHDPFILQDTRIERAFNYDDRGEEAAEYEEILESYMRGGYMILEDKILKSGPHARKNMTDMDFLKNEYRLLEEIDELMQAKIVAEKENRPLSASDIRSFA